MLELPFCNSDCFQLFLDIFSKQNEEVFKIIILDNGAFHKAKQLKIPENILLIFLPPYSPELNPAEKIWQRFKRVFTNQLFKTLDEVSDFFSTMINELSNETIISICSFKYIFEGLNWSN